jgi:hypothetical protein
MRLSWSEDLAKLCLDLVTVADTLKVTERSLARGDVWDSQKLLSRTVAVTHKLSRTLGDLKNELGKAQVEGAAK